ncbi:MAG TPA: hypothetical protein VMH02_12140 [Verrucomicrobiae bacterium]|nr:hypothetical protein [Verrucomicrobiae bacterium]
MSDPMDPEFTATNPIVAAASRIRARRELGAAIDSASGAPVEREPEDAQESLRLFADRVSAGAKRLNSILGAHNGVKVVVLERPLRLRLRFRQERVALALDDVHQLVRIAGLGLDGDYQFDPSAQEPALINLSIVSTEQGYGERLTASSLLKRIAQDAELPPPQRTSLGPLSF